MEPLKPGEFLKPESKKKGLFEGWTAVEWFWGITGLVIFITIATAIRVLLNINKDWSWAIVMIGIALAYQVPKLFRKKQ